MWAPSWRSTPTCPACEAVGHSLCESLLDVHCSLPWLCSGVHSVLRPATLCCPACRSKDDIKVQASGAWEGWRSCSCRSAGTSRPTLPLPTWNKHCAWPPAPACACLMHIPSPLHLPEIPPLLHPSGVPRPRADHQRGAQGGEAGGVRGGRQPKGGALIRLLHAPLPPA